MEVKVANKFRSDDLVTQTDYWSKLGIRDF